MLTSEQLDTIHEQYDDNTYALVECIDAILDVEDYKDIRTIAEVQQENSSITRQELFDVQSNAIIIFMELGYDCSLYFDDFHFSLIVHKPKD